MNRLGRYIWQSLSVVYLAAHCNFTFCQSLNLPFKNSSLNDVIKDIEQNSEYIFNYDPDLLNEYFFTGKIYYDNLELSLSEVLFESPYTFEITDNTILVYRADPMKYIVCGYVKEASSSEPLIAANIKAIGTIKGTQSDLNGFFEFELVAEKNQKIAISYIGYETITFNISSVLENDCPTYFLDIDQDLLSGEIIISDYILDGISQGDGYGSFEMDFNQLSKNHSSVEHDILKTAQLLPGVNSIDDSATNLQIRGSSPGQNLILWESVPLYNAGHIFGMISAINPFTVDDVSIYKGAHHPKYDNRVGGIVDISLSDELTTGFHGSIGTTFTELHSNLSIPIVNERLKIELAGRKNINGIYKSPAIQSYTDKVFQFSIIDEQAREPESAQIKTNQTLNYHDWNAKILFRPIDRLNINCGMYNNFQDFSYSFSFEGDPFLSEDKINIETNIFNVEADLEITKKWSTKFSFYNSTYGNNYKQEEFESDVQIYFNEQINNIKESSFSFSNDLNILPYLKLNLGYEYNTKEVELDLGNEINFDAEFVPIGVEKAHFQNIFQSLNYSKNKLQIALGNRSTHYREQNKWVHSPRINLQYSINKHLKMKADAGIYHQFISQLTNIGLDQIKVDNPLWILNSTDLLLSQKANKVAAGFVFHKNKWLIDVDAYHNQTDGLSTLTPLLGVLSSENGFSKGSSITKGIDVLIKKRWSGLNTWLNYSLGNIAYNFTDISENTLIAPNDIRHNLSLIASYKYKDFQFAINTNYHSGLPYSRPDLVFNEEDPDAEPPFLYFLEYENYNNYRLSKYLRFDLNLSYRFKFKSAPNLRSEISFTLINVLNRNNVVAREYYLVYDDETSDYSLASIQKVLLDRTPLLLFRFYW